MDGDAHASWTDPVTLPDGSGESIARCALSTCGVGFVPRDSTQRFHTLACAWRWRDTEGPDADARRERSKARSRARYARITGKAATVDPPAHEYLPGAAVSLRFVGLDRPLSQRDARHLHGLVSAIAGAPHDPQGARWALYPYGDGCAIHWRDPTIARANVSIPARLGAVPVTAVLGPLVRVRMPAVVPEGSRRVSLPCYAMRGVR